MNAMAMIQARGYHVVYKENETNYCPGCGRTHWHIGRITAECAFCGTALSIEVTRRDGKATIIQHKNMRREAGE